MDPESYYPGMEEQIIRLFPYIVLCHNFKKSRGGGLPQLSPLVALRVFIALGTNLSDSPLICRILLFVFSMKKFVRYVRSLTLLILFFYPMRLLFYFLFLFVKMTKIIFEVKKKKNTKPVKFTKN